MDRYLLPPSVTGKYYCIEHFLGEGSFGKVYRGYELSAPNQPVAVKLPKMILNSKGILSAHRRTLREVGLLQRIANPKVVRCLDYGKDASFSYAVMEYVPTTLALVDVTPQVIEDCVEQLPELLDVLYKSRVAHCDLRENNVGYSNRTLKLLDFGLAIPFECSVMYLGRQAQGCLPQEFRRFNMVTRTTDTYSAGRILERLLTKEYARSPTRAIAKMKEIYGKEPPRSFQRMFRRMLRHDHYLRPNPQQLKGLSQEVLQDLRKSNPFSLEETVSLAEAGIDFGLSSSSS